MTLAAGRLRHRVSIEQYLALLDSNGEVLQDPDTGEVLMDWVALAEVWAAIEPLSTREFFAAQSVQSKVSARIIIRYRPDIDAAMRLRHNQKIYNIEGILATRKSYVL